MISKISAQQETLKFEAEKRLPFVKLRKPNRFSTAMDIIEQLGYISCSENLKYTKCPNNHAIVNYYTQSHKDKRKLYQLYEAFSFQKYNNRKLSYANDNEYISKFDSTQLNDNPELVYVSEYIDFLQDIEFKYMLWSGPYLYKVYPIDMSFRKKIVLFLMSCQMMFNSGTETYQLAIALFDQCIYKMGSQDIDSCNKMALISFFMAFKLEEVSIFPISRIMELAGNKFTEDDLCEMERDMIHCLNINISLPIPINYLQIFMMMEKPPKCKYVYEAGKLFMDICLWNPKFGGYPYSVSNAVCYCVAMHAINGVEISEMMWKDYFRNLTGVLWQDIEYLIYRFIGTFHSLIQKQKMNYFITIHKAHINLNKELVWEILNLFYRHTMLENKVFLDFCAVCSYTEKYRNFHEPNAKTN